MEVSVKNRIYTAVYYIITAIFILVGPQTFIRACATTEKVMKCHWAVRAEFGVGIIIAAAGLLTLIFKSKEIRVGVSLLTVFTSIVGILIPSVLIGGCSNLMMACRTVTFPAIYAISGITLTVSLVNSIYLLKALKKHENE